MRTRLIAWIFVTSLVGACEREAPPDSLPPPVPVEPAPPPQAPRTAATNLDAVVWMQRSATYDGACRQTFAAALEIVEERLADPDSSALVDPPAGYAKRPPAVIVDIDETMLDNSPYQARLALAGKEHTPEAWEAWVEERSAAPVPGALAFAKAASDRGVTIFYVTNRHAAHREATRENLARAGFPLASEREVVLTRDGDDKDKEARRRAVAESHRVLLLIGDQLGDFVSAPDDAHGRELAARHGERFGGDWLVIPNPAYGEWRPKSLAEREALLLP